MIPSLGSHALKALTPQTAVNVDHSRCVRHRCNRNECSKCMEVCKTGAITWQGQGLCVASSLCTQCLSCLAVCPTAALQSPGLSLLQVLSDLATHSEPVLGCAPSPGSKKHAHLSCLGYLGHPELMLLFSLVFAEGVQLDLSYCPGCSNNHVLKSIGAAHAFITRLMPCNKIQLVNDENNLNYKPASLSRRELFSFFRKHSSRTAAAMVERLQVSARRQPYGSKQVPMVRTLLLKAMDSLPESQKRQVADQLFGHISFTSECTACGGCVGVCPTGAIDVVEDDQPTPSFDQQLCVDCESCNAFCRKQGVQLTDKNQNTASMVSA